MLGYFNATFVVTKQLQKLPVVILIISIGVVYKLSIMWYDSQE